MSDQSSSATGLSIDSAAFGSQFPFAALRFTDSDKRRKTAAKFARHSLPGDLAAQAAAMFRAGNDDASLPEQRERTNSVEAALPVLPRLRVVVPMIEPNVLPMARCHALFIPKPTVTVMADGVWQVEWQSFADHEAATRGVHEHYVRTHEVTGYLADDQTRLDTWHNPFLLVAVRHVYADGTKAVSRWMCADGNARLHGARLALARDLTDWGVTHEWTDPAAYWSADMATVRSAVTAARSNLAESDLSTTPWPRSVSTTEQWADFIIPGSERDRATLDTWLYHEHNTRKREEEVSYPVEDNIDSWLRGLDVFAGLSAETISDIVGADVATKDGREEVSAHEEEVDRFLRAVVANKDRTAARLTLAAAALDATETSSLDVFVSEDWKDEEFTTSDWWVKGSVFHAYARRATQRTREADFTLSECLNTAREYLAEVRSFPACDLWGIYQDIDNGVHDGTALTDPGSDWFTVTAMLGLSYALLHGHLFLDPVARPLRKARDAEYNTRYEAAEALVDAEGRAFTDADEPDEAPETSEYRREVAYSLLYREPGQTLPWLVGHPDGQAVLVYYAQCATNGEVPEDRIATAGQVTGKQVRR